MRFLWALPFLLIFLSACGGGGEAVPTVPLPPGAVRVLDGGPVVPTPQPTATPYPTFTPWPTSTRVPVPTRFVFEDPRLPVSSVPSVVPGPSDDPWGSSDGAGATRLPVDVILEPPGVSVSLVSSTPGPVAGDDPGSSPVPSGVSAPVDEVIPPIPLGVRSYGALPFDSDDDGVDDGWVEFIHQSLFPLQIPRVPETLTTGNPFDLPEPYSVISSSARYIFWTVMYDVRNAPEGWSFTGTVRWINQSPGLRAFLMFEAPVTLSRDTFQVFEGIGQSLPGFWSPGSYRVDFVDENLEEVVSWEFDVR